MIPIHLGEYYVSYPDMKTPFNLEENEPILKRSFKELIEDYNKANRVFYLAVIEESVKFKKRHFYFDAATIFKWQQNENSNPITKNIIEYYLLFKYKNDGFHFTATSEFNDMKGRHIQHLVKTYIDDFEGFYELGYDYLHGRGVKVNVDKGINMFKKGLEFKHKHCCRELIYQYKKKKQFQEMIKYINIGVKNNICEAFYELGKCYAKGLGVSQNMNFAELIFLQTAALHNHQQSYYRLGFFYWNKKEWSKAFQMWKKSNLADTFMGWCYQNGKGTIKNIYKARSLYRHNNAPEALMIKAYCHYIGEVFEKNLDDSSSLIYRAAIQNVKTAELISQTCFLGDDYPNFPLFEVAMEIYAKEIKDSIDFDPYESFKEKFIPTVKEFKIAIRPRKKQKLDNPHSSQPL